MLEVLSRCQELRAQHYHPSRNLSKAAPNHQSALRCAGRGAGPYQSYRLTLSVCRPTGPPSTQPPRPSAAQRGPAWSGGPCRAAGLPDATPLGPWARSLPLRGSPTTEFFSVETRAGLTIFVETDKKSRLHKQRHAQARPAALHNSTLRTALHPAPFEPPQNKTNRQPKPRNQGQEQIDLFLRAILRPIPKYHKIQETCFENKSKSKHHFIFFIFKLIIFYFFSTGLRAYIQMTGDRVASRAGRRTARTSGPPAYMQGVMREVLHLSARRGPRTEDRPQPSPARERPDLTRT